MATCRELARQLSKSDPAHIGYLALLHNTEANESVMHARQGDFDKALPLAEQSVEHAQQLFDRNPGVSEYQADLAQQCILLASVRGELGLSGAEELRERARPILEELLEENPDALRFRLNLASLHNNSATHMLNRRADPETIIPRYELAKEMALNVLADDPKNGGARYLLSVVNGGLAGCYDKLGNYTAALEAVDKSLDGQNRPDLIGKFTTKRALVLAHLGRRHDSLDVLHRLDELPPLRPDAAYKAAAAWAVCAQLIQEDDELAEPEKEELTAECVSNAMTRLKQSRDGGELQSESSLEAFRSSNDFDSLRGLPVFQEFVASLELTADATQPSGDE